MQKERSTPAKRTLKITLPCYQNMAGESLSLHRTIHIILPPRTDQHLDPIKLCKLGRLPISPASFPGLPYI